MARFSAPKGRLEERFADKAPPLSPTEAMREAARCLYCADAPCTRACPTRIDVSGFIRKIGTGNLRGSARTILSSNLLGASCARVCPVEVLCEGSCVYTADGQEAIRIGQLQRYAMDHGGGPALLARASARSGRSIGLVGAGPASLACAGQLALLGHDTVIYEKRAWPGGLNTTGVAPYKMRTDAALAEAESILALGVKLETGLEIGRDVAAEELLRRHDVLFLGPGLGDDARLGVPGEDGPGVLGAVDWIERMKNDPGCSLDGISQAVVVGGGNTAVDVVRELLGLGVSNVYLVYRRSAAEMPAYAHEVDGARRAGMIFLEDVVVTEVLRGQDGALEGVRLAEAENGAPTGVTHGELVVDLVVLAIGQARLARLVSSFPDVMTDESGRIVTDEEMRTGNRRIFAGGDAVNGGQEVVNAAAHGHSAARAIHAQLGGATVGTGTATTGGRDG